MQETANIQIRNMVEADLSKVIEIFKESFTALGEEWSDETALGHIRQSFFEDANWVAEQDGGIVAFLMGAISVREKGSELFIDNIVVHPNYQHQGIGKLLWGKAEEYVSEKNLTGIRLLSNEAFASYRWYEEMGFKKSGWIELFKQA